MASGLAPHPALHRTAAAGSVFRVHVSPAAAADELKRSETEGFQVATRKTGSRRLVVDGTTYRWRIRRRATNSQADYGCDTLHVAVELAERPGAVLVLYTDHAHPADWGTQLVVPVRPSDVAGWVRAALAAGWMPSRAGPQFIHYPVSAPACSADAEPFSCPPSL